MSWFCCVTGYSLLDVWTLVHLAFWIFMGSNLWALKKPLGLSLVWCMGVAYAWEIFEYFIAFRLWPDRWLDPESWWNSLLTDPLTCLIGVAGIYWLLNHRKRKDG